MANRVNAEQAVKGPAIGLIILGVFDLLADISMMIGGKAVTDSWVQQMQKSNPDIDPEMFAMDFSSPLTLVQVVVGLAVAGLTIYGGVQMLKVRSWGLALTGTILALIPCLGPCCGLGIPIGIWALIVLLKPEVKAAFAGGPAARGSDDFGSGGV